MAREIIVCGHVPVQAIVAFCADQAVPDAREKAVLAGSARYCDFDVNGRQAGLATGHLRHPRKAGCWR
jgi:hypothetical protein